MKKLKLRLAPKPEPVKVSTPIGYSTQDAEVMKRLSNAGIRAKNCYGSPMTFVYHAEDTSRIQAVLGG